MPLLSLQRHWLKSIIVFSLIAGIGLPVAWKKGTASYYSEAVIQINYRYAPNLRTIQEIETRSVSEYNRLAQQQMRTMTRFDVLKRALDSLGDKRWYWQKPDESEQRAIQRLSWSLQIKAVHDTYLITIGLWDEDPKVIPVIVNAVVESYLKAAREEIFFGESLRLENLDNRRQEHDVRIAQLSKELESTAKKLGLMTFEEGMQNPYDRILVDMTSALSQATERRVTAEAELEALTGKHERLLKLSVDAEAQKLTASDRPLGDLRAYLYQRRAQLIQTMSGLKPTHPGRQADELEIEQINQEIEMATKDKFAEIKSILDERRRADMRAEMAAFEAKAEEAQQIEQALQARVDERTREVENFMQVYNQGLRIKEELERQRRQLTLILDRIDEIKIEENAPGYVRLISLAEVPLRPASGGRKKIFILFLIVAGGAALVLPLALDFLDSRIRTPIDLHRILGFAPNSWLPVIQDEDARILFDQQMERLAISIFRDINQSDAASSFFVTAILPGVGKTFVIYQLADHLQRLGINTLVLSCDPSNRSAALEAAAREIDYNNLTKRKQADKTDQNQKLEPQLSSAPASPGLMELMRDTAELDQVIIRRGSEDADWIGFGRYADAEELANIVRFRQVLDDIQKQYRLVLIDGPAILLSASAEAIAGICYGTLIIVDSIDTPVRQLKRALRIIERASPEVVGAVLNHAPLFKRSGYFSQLAKSLARYRSEQTDAASNRS